MDMKIRLFSRIDDHFGVSNIFQKRFSSLWWSPIPIVVVALLGFLMTDFAFRQVSNGEREKTENAFREASRDRVLVIQREIEHTLGVVQDIASFFDASRDIGRREFRKYVGPVLMRYSGIQALEWVPSVPGVERTAFISDAKRGFHRFKITEHSKNGNLVTASKRDRHFPILYVQPYKQNKDLLGFDLASEPGSLALLSHARDSGEMQISTPILLNKSGSGMSGYGFSVYIPVYNKSDGSKTDTLRVDSPAEESAQKELNTFRGTAVGVFHIAGIIERSLKNFAPSGINMRFYDMPEEGEQQFLYEHVSRVDSHELNSVFSVQQNEENILEFDQILMVGNKRWKVACSPIPGHFQIDPWSGWIILFGGFSFTTLLTVYLLSLVGRTRKVDTLVSERTEQLDRAVEALNSEINERKSAELALQNLNETLEMHVAIRTAESERRAGELEQFAYVTSHDLKAPLRAISNLASWLKEDLEEKLTDDTREQLLLLQDRVKRMQALIDGLLEYSRAGRTSVKIETVNTEILIKEIVDSLSPPPGFTIDIESNMPIFQADSLHLGQVFANLIGNSIKHSEADKGEIKINVEEDEIFYRFCVADDGPGIAPEYHDKIFMMFQVLQTSDQESNTGIGLALVKKIILEQGGVITLDSKEGCGSKFCFTWRKNQDSLQAN